MPQGRHEKYELRKNLKMWFVQSNRQRILPWILCLRNEFEVHIVLNFNFKCRYLLK